MVQWTISSDERAEHKRGVGRKLRPILMQRTETLSHCPPGVPQVVTITLGWFGTVKFVTQA